ncbi:group I intron-associated PD-(D/E)XK endonuclease [Actinomadura kijaniata]|uniref:group I intron-associated PD-(D/E)XK endonuclease n=1 Tax=Actinomadura kijaniata TaxID=46161 RepID=UPI003F1DB656
MGRPRKWTDEQLREAVATSSSWNEVVRKIGRKPNTASRRTVRGHVARLGLDVSHLPPLPEVEPIFSGQVTVPREDLQTAVARSRSWAEVIRCLGQDVNGSAYTRVKRQVLASGMDISHFSGQAWGSCRLEAEGLPFANGKKAEDLHRVGAVAAGQWFLARGYMVALPLETTSYDLVVESDEGFKRIQVKTTRTLQLDGKHIVGLTKTQYGGGRCTVSAGRHGSRTYEASEIDYFFIYTSHAEKYLIPIGVVENSRSIVLDGKYAQYRLPD